MSERPADLAADLRRVAAESLAAGGGHPPAEELIAYHRRSLPEPRAEELRDHLAVCAECTALVLDLDEHWDPGAAAAAESAYAPWHRRPGPPWALAASLAALALGLAGWIATRGPAAGSGYLAENLDPVTSAMRSAPAAQEVEVPAGADHVVLILNAGDLRDPRGDGVVNATLRARGAVVARSAGPLDEVGQFTLVVPSRELRPGEYEIVLRASGGARTELEYRFRVVRRGGER